MRMEPTQNTVGNEGQVSLKRSIGLLSATSLVVGTMIGSGIFVSPGGLLNLSGSVWLSFVIWSSCGALSLLGSMGYAELATVVESSGAEYSILLKAFGPIPAFLFSWLCTLVIRPSSIAILCVSFANYCIEPFTEKDVSEYKLPISLLSTVAIALVTYINCFSVKMAAKLMNYLTTSKILALIIIITGGVYNVIQGKTENLTFTFTGSNLKVGDLSIAFYQGLWAYEGWNQLNFVTEEIKNPHRNVALALLLGVPFVTVLYLLANVAYLTELTPEEVMESSSVAAIYGDRMLGVMSFLIPLTVATSTLGSLNGSLFTTGRLAYSASREGHLPQILSFVDISRNTPSISLCFNGVLTCIYASAVDLEGLIDVFSFTQWAFYGASMAAVIRLRTLERNAPRPFKVPIIVPWVVLLASIFLVLTPVIQNPKLEYFYAIGFAVLGLIAYYLLVYRRMTHSVVGKVTRILQIIFVSVAPE